MLSEYGLWVIPNKKNHAFIVSVFTLSNTAFTVKLISIHSNENLSLPEADKYYTRPNTKLHYASVIALCNAMPPLLFVKILTQILVIKNSKLIKI